MTEDLMHVAAELVSYLAPLTPVLLNVGEGAAEEAGRRLGADALAAAKRIWARLQPAIDGDKRASAAVAELSADPDDQDLRAQLRIQLRRLLADDHELAVSLAAQLAAAPPRAVSVTGIVVHGDVRGGKQIGIQLGEPLQARRRQSRG